ncbi:hypothetical protein BVG16_13725 [Paenibacillus selenitireducens]|uniref:Phage capsid-like C-terminal domain-containing protein n=1 Tax=Paenibacillus selenitireducens TaxID=1324314 RepID=A0A1T2XC69_9BACL|nr:phage major capsid protein [Paenibacillus selenitireducens]OPA77507.1 hypothetical protein BVG16_13725 [Paenibacillus selenitireducens]
MKNKVRELRQLLAAKKEAATVAANEGRTEEARSMLSEMRSLQEQIQTLEELDDVQVPIPGTEVPVIENEEETRSMKKVKTIVSSKEYRTAFFNRVLGEATNKDRQMLEEVRTLSGITGKDGGYLVPKDVETEIIRLKRDLPQLEKLVRVIPVKSNTGTRNIETGSRFTKFLPLAELQDMKEGGSPQFSQVPFSVVDKGGFFPIPNDLLDDSPEDIEAYLAEWIARGVVGTRNGEILVLLGAIESKVPIANIQDLKKILNVTLDPAISKIASIITNQDGFNHLDSLVDGQGRPLLQPNPSDSTGRLLLGKPVEVVSNEYLPSTGTTEKKAPIFIGSFSDFIVIFERQGYRIDTTNVGGNSWRNNSTEARVIYRDDTENLDSAAVVAGEITLA